MRKGLMVSYCERIIGYREDGRKIKKLQSGIMCARKCGRERRRKAGGKKGGRKAKKEKGKGKQASKLG